MVEHAGLISEFMSIVNCNEQLAQFYLEANNWDLSGALTAYYENPPPSSNSSDIDQATNTAFGSNQQESKTSSTQNNPSSSSRTNINSSRFATIHDLENEPMDEDDDEDDENKNLFAGGEKSGIFMQNPNAKPNKQASSLVTDILKKATEGSRAHTEEPEVAASSATSSQVFTGTGYRLGSDEEPSTIIPGTSSDNNTEEEEPATTVRHLTFWRNGFSVEDGPLMSYDDPENQEFLKAIRSGRAPLSLLNVSQNQPVDVRVSRRLDEDYKPPPKKPIRPFSGSGQRLGSITPVVISSQSAETDISNTDISNTDTATADAATTNTTQSIREFEVDESLPVTSLQIRLGDGTRMLARFNHTHTVNDIRNFINASRVGEAQRNYLLQTTFPVKDLNDGSQTLEDASLLNSVVIQRYI